MGKDTRALLERLDHGDIPPGTHVRDLRPAAQQVVSIARALSRDARLLILDEPSAILDDHEIDILFKVVKRLAEEGVGMVYISHRLDEIVRIGNRVTVLVDGKTVATGLPADTPPAELVLHMVGRRVEQLFPSRATAQDNVVLEVRDLSRLPDVKPASFEVRAGEVLGIGGLVGSGRTELLRLIYGLEPPDSGEVHVDGRRLPRGRTSAAIKAGMGMAPEDRKSQGLLLGWDLTKNVSIADLGKFVRGALINGRSERSQVAEQLRELKTKPDDPDRLASELSGGNQQKVVLARWLMRECRVLLFDEPTRGVDVGAKQEIYRLIADLAKNGIAVVMVSSETEELLGLSTRILVMREGEIVAELDGTTTDEVELLSHAVAHTETSPILEEAS